MDHRRPRPRPRRRPRARPRKRRSARRTAAGWPLLLAAIVAIVLLYGLLSVSRLPHGGARPLTADEARASNAAVPIAAGRLPPAARFVFHGSPAGREQAAECLATAALYEAGRDPRGQRAVIQVVLNRVRLPGFPKTVCGVVYQGAGRTSGCQFSFVCDGSVTRRPERAGWEQARRLAQRALRGQVYAPVGRASHYHADWMVPYWRPSLAKVAQVGGHIFYMRPCRSCSR